MSKTMTRYCTLKGRPCLAKYLIFDSTFKRHCHWSNFSFLRLFDIHSATFCVDKGKVTIFKTASLWHILASWTLAYIHVMQRACRSRDTDQKWIQFFADDSRIAGWLEKKTDTPLIYKMKCSKPWLFRFSVKGSNQCLQVHSCLLWLMRRATDCVYSLGWQQFATSWGIHWSLPHRIYPVIKSSKYHTWCFEKSTVDVSITKLRGQCYDGASSISGHKSGVAAILRKEESRAVYTHCYGHALSLACSDAVKNCRIMKDALDTSYELIKLVKKSPRRDPLLQKLKEQMPNDSPGIRVLCPTRWTVRAQALHSILATGVIMKFCKFFGMNR